MLSQKAIDKMEGLIEGFKKYDPSICNIKRIDNGFEFEAKDWSVLHNKGREQYQLVVSNGKIVTIADGGIRNEWEI